MRIGLGVLPAQSLEYRFLEQDERVLPIHLRRARDQLGGFIQIA